MIDPLLSLAYSMHSDKGIYALLLGSGVSRSASIPTGWEILTRLVASGHIHVLVTTNFDRLIATPTSITETATNSRKD